MDNDPTTEIFVKNSVDKINTFRSAARNDEDLKKDNYEEKKSLLCSNYESSNNGQQNDQLNFNAIHRKLKKFQDDDIHVSCFKFFNLK